MFCRPVQLTAAVSNCGVIELGPSLNGFGPASGLLQLSTVSASAGNGKATGANSMLSSMIGVTSVEINFLIEYV